MGLDFWTRRGVALVVMGAGLAVGMAVSSAASSAAQTILLTEPSGPLLPAKFGEWKKAASNGETPSYSLMAANKDAMQECGPQRSQVAEYTRGGRDVHVEAIQFGDRTGAVSAFTLAERPGMRVGKELGASDAVGVAPDSGGAVLFTVGSTVVLANFGGTATAADVAALKPLALVMPKVIGNTGVAPLLPTLAPAKGLVQGSVRYALGPVSYAAEGGVLPANSLGWDKEAEAVTALYNDARGKETLTALLYPTPMIAENITKTIQNELPRTGPNFEMARVRREGTLVVLASGSFSGDEAQRMVDNIHLREMTFNQNEQPSFQVMAGQTFTLLQNIAILSGMLVAGTVLLGLFLGFGRAGYRVMRGKPAAVEQEFLSLHLSPQNKPAEFDPPDPEKRRQVHFREF
jgi:hypothetical protein